MHIQLVPFDPVCLGGLATFCVIDLLITHPVLAMGVRLSLVLIFVADSVDPDEKAFHRQTALPMLPLSFPQYTLLVETE